MDNESEVRAGRDEAGRLQEDQPAGADSGGGNGKPFEENMARLEVLVRQLERGELSLEDALACYQEGVALVGVCQQSLERLAKEIEILTEGMKK